MELKAGDCIQTQKGNVLRVKDEIGSGGQGWVYSVECAGQIKALKIDKPDGLRDQEKFIKNLEENASLPEPPSPFLVWPQDVVKLADGSYGYVMEMVQKPFINFERFLLPLAKGGVRFSSFKAMTDASSRRKCSANLCWASAWGCSCCLKKATNTASTPAWG